MNDLSDPRFGHLKHLPNVQRIWFYDTRGTDVFLARVRGMKSVKSFSFTGTDLSEEGMQHLASFPDLESVRFSDGYAAPRGVEKLQEALPDCEITY